MELNSRESLRATLAEELHSSVDGRGLEQSDRVLSQHHWVAGATGLLSGANYIGTLKVCGNLLYSATRAARGRPHMSVLCDACRRPETLGHILQVCSRTHASRISRHDKIVSLVQTTAGHAGWSCIREPAIDLLQLAVPWYKIRHAGEQAYYYSRTGTAKQCYFILSNLNFLCFGCPSAGIIISLLSNMADFVPCDR